MRTSIDRAVCVPLLAFSLVACTSATTAPPEREHAAAPSVHAAPPAPARDPVVPTSAPAPASLSFKAQPGWVVETPSSAMRKAQYSLPHGAESGEDASLVVYFFGGGGGSREANLERWASQFEQPDGSPSADKLQSSTRTVAGHEVLDADLSGRYVAETAPGSGVHYDKPDWRMLATIVETPEGPYYFKLVGPAATVAHWKASYDAFVEGIAPAR